VLRASGGFRITVENRRGFDPETLLAAMEEVTAMLRTRTRGRGAGRGLSRPRVSAVAAEILDRNLPRFRVEREG
jgi:hypothetical protein